MSVQELIQELVLRTKQPIRFVIQGITNLIYVMTPNPHQGLGLKGGISVHFDICQLTSLGSIFPDIFISEEYYNGCHKNRSTFCLFHPTSDNVLLGLHDMIQIVKISTCNLINLTVLKPDLPTGLKAPVEAQISSERPRSSFYKTYKNTNQELPEPPLVTSNLFAQLAENIASNFRHLLLLHLWGD
ncbi:Endogenous retrovirus group 3 member 1 Env polyprotein [Plecturocebus cupreus]